MTLRSFLLTALLAPALLAVSACHSDHIDATIENHTSSPIELIEVDYPSASFGVDALAPGAIFHYRFQIRGSGPVRIQYSTSDGKQIQNTGPSLVEGQQGQLRILLLPSGKTEFDLRLTPRS